MRYIEPSLGAFASYDLTQDPKIILMKLIDKGSVLDVISDLEDEFLILNQEIGQKYEMMDLDYPRFPIDQFKLVRRVFGFFLVFFPVFVQLFRIPNSCFRLAWIRVDFPASELFVFPIF